MVRFWRTVVTIGMAATLLVACGSDKPSIDTSKVLTKAQYIEASDEICDTYGDRITGVVSSAGAGLSLQEAKDTFRTKLIPLFQAERKALLALKPPKADAAEMNGALVAMNSGINTIIGRVEGATSIAELNAINPTGIARWKAAVGEYGMTRCGSKPATSTTTTQPV